MVAVGQASGRGARCGVAGPARGLGQGNRVHAVVPCRPYATAVAGSGAVKPAGWSGSDPEEGRFHAWKLGGPTGIRTQDTRIKSVLRPRPRGRFWCSLRRSHARPESMDSHLLGLSLTAVAGSVAVRRSPGPAGGLFRCATRDGCAPDRHRRPLGSTVRRHAPTCLCDRRTTNRKQTRSRATRRAGSIFSRCRWVGTTRSNYNRVRRAAETAPSGARRGLVRHTSWVVHDADAGLSRDCPVGVQRPAWL